MYIDVLIDLIVFGSIKPSGDLNWSWLYVIQMQPPQLYDGRTIGWGRLILGS